MMIKQLLISPSALRSKIRSADIVLAGNSKLKIYGTLHCQSGKRMKQANRVFFSSEQEALQYGFRPCGHCMKKAYAAWKLLNVSPA
jgi:methylphosphotriester-DNA--protein-cysteine methyltransferase